MGRGDAIYGYALDAGQESRLLHTLRYCTEQLASFVSPNLRLIHYVTLFGGEKVAG